MTGLLYVAVHSLHNMSGGSNVDCIAHYSGVEEWKCVFAPVSQKRPRVHASSDGSALFLQYTFPFIKRPIFVLNSLYDTAQLSGILGLKCLPPNCDADQMKYFENFRNVSLTETLTQIHHCLFEHRNS